MTSSNHRKTVFPGFTRTETVPSLLLPRTVTDHEKEMDQSVMSRKFASRSRIPVQVSINMKKPWSEYSRIMKMDLAGPIVQAHKRNKPQKIVAIKEVKGCSREWLRHLRTTTHEHVVTLYTAYFDEGSAFLVYDLMSVALNDILATPRGPLEIAEVATVCQNVTSGLHHIHKDLGIAHGALSGETVLLHSTSGQVKIANIGESMLKSKPCRDFQHDLKCMGDLLQRMLELELGLRPEEHDDSAVDFLKQARSESAAVLLQHQFLQKALGHSFLLPYVKVAEPLIGRDVEIISRTRA